MFRPTRARIDLERIKSNCQNLRSVVPTGFFCPMVKANAYGHGDVEVAKAVIAAGVQQVGVVMVEEAIGLRQGGIRADILCFSRLTKESASTCVEQQITPVVSSWDDLEILKALSRPLPFHLKLDTGMHRMGFDIKEVNQLREFITQPKLKCEGVCTHLSHGQDAANPGGRSQAQISKFLSAFREFGIPTMVPHVLNSDALLAMAAAKLDCDGLGARPGLALYGLYQSPIVKPALTLTTRLDLVRRVPKGESVSYGGRWTASKEAWIGIVPLGYGDGYPRALSNKSQMLFRGKRVPVVGTICMDYSLLDLTTAIEEGEPKPGEEIVAIGEQKQATISVIELAEIIGTIPYEIVTGLSARIPRIY